MRDGVVVESTAVNQSFQTFPFRGDRRGWDG